MKDYYKTLGLLNSASQEEIKRSYRILARRYHPDISQRESSSEKFKEIQNAYNTLKDLDKRKLYDATAEAFIKQKFNSRLKSYANSYGKNNSQTAGAKPTGETVRKRTIRESDLSDQIEEKLGDIKEAFAEKGSWLKENFQKLKKHLKKDSDIKVSIVEVSISIEDAIKGVKKKIEIVEPEGSRKVSVVISSGVRDGSVIRLRNKNDRNEDLVLIIRLASHPYLTIKSKGLIMEIPITINEAVAGAQIKVPGIDDAILLKVQPGTQSGTELRIKEQGILGKDGKKGDLFVRFLIMAPPEPNAALLKEKTSEIQKYYEQDIRADLPETIV